jgi:hypothetical protein
VVCQIAENAGEDAVEFRHEDSPFSLADLVLGETVMADGLNSALIDGVQVDHDVLNRILLGLLLLELSPAKEPEGSRDHVARSLHQKSFDALFDPIVQLAVQEGTLGYY